MKMDLRLKGFFTLAMTVAVSGCLATPPSPDTRSDIRFEISNYDARSVKSRAGGITLDAKDVSETPLEFRITLPLCDREEGRELDEAETVDVLPSKNLLFKVSLTNETTHVARLPLAVVTLRDPVGNMYFSLSQDEIEDRFIKARGCRLSDVASDRFKTLSMITHKNLLVPGRTTGGYFVFAPHDNRLPGIWTLSIHEVPVSFDDAGRTTRTDSLGKQFLISKYADLFVRLSGEKDYSKTTKHITEGGSEEQELMEFVRLREAERAAAEKAAQEKLTAEKAAREKAEAERLAKEGKTPDPIGNFFKKLLSPSNKKGTP